MKKTVRPKKVTSKARALVLDFSFGSKRRKLPLPKGKAAASPPISERSANDEEPLDFLDIVGGDRSDPYVRALTLADHYTRLARKLRDEATAGSDTHDVLRRHHRDNMALMTRVWRLHSETSERDRRVAFVGWIEWLAEEVTSRERDGVALPIEMQKDPSLEKLVRAWLDMRPGARATGAMSGKWRLLAARYSKDSGTRTTWKRLKDDWSAHRR